MRSGRDSLRAQVAACDQLGDDADGNLWHRLRADLQPDRRGHTLQVRRGDARFAEALENEPDLAAAADQADVRRRRWSKMKEGFLVMAVPSGHDQGVGLRSDLELGQYLFDRADQQPLRPET